MIRAEAAIIASLTDARAPLTARIEEWCAVNSGSRNIAGLERTAALLAAHFAPLGTVTLHDPSPVEAVDATGAKVPLAHGRNLHVTGGTGPFHVLLTGHMDTVFAADHVFQTGRWLDADTLNAPGAADMKGGIAVMHAALSAVAASPFADALSWEIVLNADEEVSSLGSAALLADCAKRAHVGLTYEPALPDGTLAGARKGSGNFTLTVRGRAAHAGREPEKGRNAIVAAADFAVRVTALIHPGLSVNVAKVEGGGPNNIVPDLALVRFNMRPSTLGDQAAAQAAIESLTSEIAAQHGVAVDLHGHFARPPKPMDANQRRLFDLVRDCGRDLGLSIGWRDTGGVCDGNNLAAHGLPVVDTLGPRGGSIHSADEFLCVNSLVERAQLSALVLMRLAQHGLPA
jgi:glutamate carboxypeptidase